MSRIKVDWDAIEPHYRAGILTFKQMSEQFEVSDAAIIQHAKKKGWDRNLLAKIQAKADAKVSASLVSAEVSETKALTESVRVEIESEVQARIRIEHRSNITRMRALVLSLLKECEIESEHPEVFDELGELLAKSDGDGNLDKMNFAYQKAISLPTRIKGIKELSDTIKTLIAMEREAYGIDKEAPPPQAETIDEMEGARRLAFALTRAAKMIESQPTIH